MDILLLQANWGKTPRRLRRRVMTAKAKRKRFAKMIRRCRFVTPDGPKTSSHALEDIGAPIVVQELLDLSRVNRGTD